MGSLIMLAASVWLTWYCAHWFSRQSICGLSAPGSRQFRRLSAVAFVGLGALRAVDDHQRRVALLVG
jgi:hypothetical protein